MKVKIIRMDRGKCGKIADTAARTAGEQVRESRGSAVGSGGLESGRAIAQQIEVSG